MSAPRDIKHAPFCWQSKEALRRIAACEGRTDRAHVFSVYLALTWFASDEQTETFTKQVSSIAERAGVSYRKAADVLALLKRLGIIESAQNFIEGSKELGPNSYTLCTVCATSGTECLRLGTAAKTAPCRDIEKNLIEESLEDIREESARAPAPSKKRPIYPAIEAWQALAHQKHPDWPANDAQGAWEHYESVGWKKKSGPILKWEMCVATCYRNWKTRSDTAGSTVQPQGQPARIPDNVRAIQLGISIEELRQKRASREIAL